MQVPELNRRDFTKLAAAALSGMVAREPRPSGRRAQEERSQQAAAPPGAAHLSRLEPHLQRRGGGEEKRLRGPGPRCHGEGPLV